VKGTAALNQQSGQVAPEERASMYWRAEVTGRTDLEAFISLFLHAYLS